jgi:hypothetical protein
LHSSAVNIADEVVAGTTSVRPSGGCRVLCSTSVGKESEDSHDL